MKKQLKNQVLTDELLLINKTFNTYTIEFKETLPHSHTFYEIFYIISGHLIHYYNGQKQILNPGDVVIIRPNVDTHYFESIKNNPVLHRDILINSDLFLKTCNFLSPKLCDFINEKTYPICATLSNEHLSFFEGRLSKIKIDSYYESDCPPTYTATLAMLLAEIFENRLNAQQQNYNWVDRLINVLSTVQHFRIPLPELIKTHFHYELSYMCKSFKKYTGNTMSQYFTSMKLTYAKTLLASTDYSVVKIAETCGFNNLSHFYHSFKKAFGVTPLDFRKTLK
jgi:AraC family cel operon transcriptional repressor